MARLTVEDLHEVKRNGQKIAAAVVYEYQMTKICEMAGVDVLSVGDSLGRNMLGHDHVDECTVDDMIPFVLAGVRGRERAIVSVDMPTVPSAAGVEAVAAAAQTVQGRGRRGHGEDRHPDARRGALRGLRRPGGWAPRLPADRLSDAGSGPRDIGRAGGPRVHTQVGAQDRGSRGSAHRPHERNAGHLRGRLFQPAHPGHRRAGPAGGGREDPGDGGRRRVLRGHHRPGGRVPRRGQVHVRRDEFDHRQHPRGKLDDTPVDQRTPGWERLAKAEACRPP